MGTYSRCTLIHGWALNNPFDFQGGHQGLALIQGSTFQDWVLLTFLAFRVGTRRWALIQGAHLFMDGHLITLLIFRVDTKGWHLFKVALIQGWVLINFFGFQGGHWGSVLIQGGHLFKAGHLLTFLAFRLGTGDQRLFKVGIY